MNPSHWLMREKGLLNPDIIFGGPKAHLQQRIAQVSSPSSLPLFALFIPRKNGLRPTESGYESSLE